MGRRPRRSRGLGLGGRLGFERGFDGDGGSRARWGLRPSGWGLEGRRPARPSAPCSRLRRERPRETAANVPTPASRTNAAEMTMIRTSSMTGRDYRWRRPDEHTYPSWRPSSAGLIRLICRPHLPALICRPHPAGLILPASSCRPSSCRPHHAGTRPARGCNRLRNYEPRGGQSLEENQQAACGY